MDATATTKASVEHKMAASSPNGRSALTNQLLDCLFYLGSVVRMCREEWNIEKIANVHSVSLLLVSNYIVT